MTSKLDMSRFEDKNILFLNFCEKNLTKLENGNNKFPSVEMCGALNCVGIAHSNLGKNKKSLEYRIRALNMVKEVHGKNLNIDLIFYLNNVGRVCFYLKNYKKALEYHEQAKEIGEELFKNTPSNMDVAQTFRDIGNIHLHLKEYTEALEYYEKGRKIGKEFCKNAKITPTILMAKFSNNIGNIYCNLGKEEEALKFYKEVLEVVFRICKRSFDDEAEENLEVILHNIREVLYNLKKDKEVPEYSMKIFKEKLKLSHPLKRNYSCFF